MLNDVVYCLIKLVAEPAFVICLCVQFIINIIIKKKKRRRRKKEEEEKKNKNKKNKPALSIGNCFVSKRFHDCIVYNNIV
jgi:hypothetical protein